MANYSSIINSLTQINTSLNADYQNISSLLTSLKGTFNGNAATKMENDIETSLGELQTTLTDVSNLVNVLKLLDEHSQDVSTLKQYEASMNNFIPGNPPRTNPYKSKVQTWKTKVSSLEANINSNLPKISRITSSINLVSSDIDLSYKNYTMAAITTLTPVKGGINVSLNASYQDLVNSAINDWIDNKFKNNAGNLRTSTLAECGYTPSEVDDIIASRSINATPRERMVIAALTIIELGLDKGIKSNYKLSRKVINSVSQPYTTENIVNNGADCASFVSYAMNNATDSTFNNATLETIKAQGQKTSFDNLQAGDILYNSGHVAVVVDNQLAENGTLVLADASHESNGGKSAMYPNGIRLQRVNRNTASSMFEAISLENYYNS